MLCIMSDSLIRAKQSISCRFGAILKSYLIFNP